MATRRAKTLSELTKQDAIRALLHSAIRMFAARENAFAIHLLVQSADKMLNDYAKGKGISLTVDFDRLLKPDDRKVFWERHRRAYNYFKHADKDFDAILGVRDIVSLNVDILSICNHHYGLVFGEKTDHMVLFNLFDSALTPKSFHNDPQIVKEMEEIVVSFGDDTPEVFFGAVLSKAGRHLFKRLARERKHDVRETETFMGTTFAKHQKKKKLKPVHRTARVLLDPLFNRGRRLHKLPLAAGTFA